MPLVGAQVEGNIIINFSMMMKIDDQVPNHLTFSGAVWQVYNFADHACN